MEPTAAVTPTSIKTKTKTPTKAQLSRQRIADAEAAIAQTTSRLNVEAPKLTAMEFRLHRGDPTLDLAELAAQRQMVADLNTLLAGQRRELTAAQRAEVTDKADLADALAPALSEILSVPVTTATDRPPAASTELPQAVLVQVSPAKHSPHDGYLSGRAVLHYIRTDLHTRASDGRIEKGLDATGVRLSVWEEGSYRLDGATVDRIVLDVRGAWPQRELPTIAAGETRRFKVTGFANALASTVRDSLFLSGSAPMSGVRFGAGVADRPMDGVATRAEDVAVTSDRTDNDGIRTRVVTFALSAWNVGRASIKYETSEFIDAIERALRAQESTHASALGRVIDTRTGSAKPFAVYEGKGTGATLQVEVTFACRVAPIVNGAGS
jgi:hypothetical protein